MKNILIILSLILVGCSSKREFTIRRYALPKSPILGFDSVEIWETAGQDTLVNFYHYNNVGRMGIIHDTIYTGDTVYKRVYGSVLIDSGMRLDITVPTITMYKGTFDEHGLVDSVYVNGNLISIKRKP